MENPTNTTNESTSLVKYGSQEQRVRKFNVLNHNFDLFASPDNFMRRRSKWEEIIYRASMAETSRKSPFASFRLALENIDCLDSIDVITGIKCIKSILSMLFSKGQEVSLMVHRVGHMVILDEFDITTFLRKTHENEWRWFREFLREQNFTLCKPDTFKNGDLFCKFLYHCLLNLNSVDASLFSPKSNAIEPISNRDSGYSNEKPTQQLHEEHARSIVWNLRNDLRLLVGSDLAIFGTEDHPCISLRLQEKSQPISVLTGIDLWLDNMLNEVAEVAMCYHSNGIVQSDFDVIKTEDIPHEAGFEASEVKTILKNLLEFLQRQKLREGRTYWLFKGEDSDFVKLYDLSDLQDISYSGGPMGNHPEDDCSNINPFTRPVATLCYKLAENRLKYLRNWRQHIDEQGIFGGRANFEETARDTHRLILNCIQCVSSSLDVRLYVQAIRLLFELRQIMISGGFNENDVDSLRAGEFGEPSVIERRKRERSRRSSYKNTQGNSPTYSVARCSVEDQIVQIKKRQVEVAVESFRGEDVQRSFNCLSPASGDEQFHRDILSHVSEALVSLAKRQQLSTYIHDVDQMPSTDRNLRYPLRMDSVEELNTSWEMSAKRELVNAAITLYQDKISYSLETCNEISEAFLETSRNNLRWWRLSEFLHFMNNRQLTSSKSLPGRLKELHGYCLARFFEIIMTLSVESRSKSMFPSSLTEMDKQLVEACLLSASKVKVDHSIDVKVKEQIARIEEGIINIERLQSGLDHIQWLLESSSNTRSKQLHGYRSLASCYIQMILLYLSLTFSELKSGERPYSEFEKGVTENHQRISTAVALSRKYDFRLEGASCLSALASQYKILASGGVTGEKTKWNPGKLNHIESALKAYSKAREILGSKHNSPEIWSELNRCRLVTVIEILHFRGMDISDQVKKDLLLSALDEKCKEDWASLDMPSFSNLVDAKFTVQRHLTALYKKSLKRKQISKMNSKKLLKEAEENTEMQRRCIEAMKLNTNVKHDKTYSLMLKTIGIATLDIILYYKDAVSDIPPVYLYQFLIEVFIPDLAKVSFEAEAYERQSVVGTEEWKEVTSLILSLLQIALKHVNSPSVQKSESHVDSLKSLYRECLLLRKQFSDHIKYFHEMLNCLRRLLA